MVMWELPREITKIKYEIMTMFMKWLKAGTLIIVGSTPTLTTLKY
jgi:hypothetical protein